MQATAGFGPPHSRHVAGMTTVLAAHAILGWALLDSLGHRLVLDEVLPLQAEIIEAPPPPPPPPPPPLQVPLTLPPPPSYVAPPEVRVRPPPAPAPAITVQRRPAPPPAPTVIAAPAPLPAPAPTVAPSPPPVPAPPPPAPPPDLSRPVRIDASRCVRPEYPLAARRAEATGTTRIGLQVGADGRVLRAEVLQRSGRTREHRMLDRAAVDALSGCRFSSGLDRQGRPIGGYTSVEYVWKLE